MKKFFILLLIGVALTCSAQSGTPKKDLASQTPAPTVLKAQLKAYRAEQNMQYKLTKLQVRLQIEQLKYQKLVQKNSHRIAIEAAKAKP